MVMVDVGVNMLKLDVTCWDIDKKIFYSQRIVVPIIEGVLGGAFILDRPDHNMIYIFSERFCLTQNSTRFTNEHLN